MTIRQRSDLTFKHNASLGRHGWLRLTPAYSVRLVDDLLASSRGHIRVLDPFSGTGTTGLVCAERGLQCDLLDVNPFLVWFAGAKVREYSGASLRHAVSLIDKVVGTPAAGEGAGCWVPPIRNIDRWWSPVALDVLALLWARILSASDDDEYASDLVKIAFCRQVIAWSNASFGHQSMSFKVPQASFLNSLDVEYMLGEFRSTALTVVESARGGLAGSATVRRADSRAIPRFDHLHDLVVTSPPYPNRMSYVRELRPYMYWLGYLEEARDAGELDWQAIGGTWGVATSRVAKWEASEPIPHVGFTQLIALITERSEALGRYVHKYFHDMLVHVRSLVPRLAPGASLHYVVGNSKFYDWVVPVQDILAGIFRAEGLADVGARVLRKRSSKKELFEFVVTARKAR